MSDSVADLLASPERHATGCPYRDGPGPHDDALCALPLQVARVQREAVAENERKWIKWVNENNLGHLLDKRR